MVRHFHLPSRPARPPALPRGECAGPAAVRACKKLVLDVAEREINASLIQSTVEGIADIRASAEGKEGVQAFLNKRKPNWLT